jgi:hypothetical protein
MADSGIADVECIFEHGTEKAILVKREEGDKNPVWFPRSKIEIEGEEYPGTAITISGPENLFLEKEMI